MEDSFRSRWKRAWNIFMNKDPSRDYSNTGPGYYYRPDRPRFTRGNEQSIVTSVYNRIALDVASVAIRHVRLDENDRYLETIDSDLNSCFALEANVDQTGRAFIQDVVMSMFDEGCVAIVPVDTDIDPEDTDSYKIYDFDFVALAAQGYSNKTTSHQTPTVEFGRSFIGENVAVDWVARYKILEGSVYYLDESWSGGIIFGIVSSVEENAFTDCDLSEVNFHWHEDDADCWFDSEDLITNSAEIFADGWFNGIHSADDGYTALQEKLAAASKDTSALVGMWQ